MDAETGCTGTQHDPRAASRSPTTPPHPAKGNSDVPAHKRGPEGPGCREVTNRDQAAQVGASGGQGLAGKRGADREGEGVGAAREPGSGKWIWGLVWAGGKAELGRGQRGSGVWVRRARQWLQGIRDGAGRGERGLQVPQHRSTSTSADFSSRSRSGL